MGDPRRVAPVFLLKKKNRFTHSVDGRDIEHRTITSLICDKVILAYGTAVLLLYIPFHSVLLVVKLVSSVVV